MGCSHPYQQVIRSSFSPEKLLLFLFLLSFSHQGAAQDSTRVSTWVHAGMEMTGYAGDLNKYAQFNGAFAAGFRLNHKPRLNGQFTLLIGTIKGENRRLDLPATSDAPNRFFSTSIIEVTYQANYHLIKTRNWAVYISQGIGIMRYNPKDENGDELSGQSATRADGESYRNITLMLPTKVGVIYLFDNSFGVGFEAGWHNPLTDYLDNISDLGNGGSDNILGMRFSLYIPVSFDVP